MVLLGDMGCPEREVGGGWCCLRTGIAPNVGLGWWNRWVDDAFPLLPFRSTLYTPAELFEGFTPDDPLSYGATPDFRAYRSTRLAPGRDIGMLRALHDQSITEARAELVGTAKVAAIMGGHQLARADPAYSTVAHLAADLTRAGLLVISGGGPGAMEAAHLGALLSSGDDHGIDEAIAHLAAARSDFPAGMNDLVTDGGHVDEALLAELHAWQVAAFDVLAKVDPANAGVSLSVPTWFYGHEPPTPFATHIAKYFSNPLREDSLLAIAGEGVVYAPGSAGTLQEIFQDAAQNYYLTFHSRFSPMVFLDLDAHWSARYPVAPLLRELFGDDKYARYVRTTSSTDEIVSFLTGPR